MRLELLPISLLKSCPFFWACPLVQEEAIPDRKLKYFSSKNPATSACFWRFLGSTGRTRNGGRVCWGRSRRPVLGPAAPGCGSSNGKLSAQPSFPEPFPVCLPSREALMCGKKLPIRSPGHPEERITCETLGKNDFEDDDWAR